VFVDLNTNLMPASSEHATPAPLVYSFLSLVVMRSCCAWL
jgi:hypothetical protein